MNLFGKKKQAPAPKISDSIQMLRETIQVLDKREKHIEKLMQQAHEEAKRKYKAKDKRGAAFHLKRKKMYEKQIDNIYGQKAHIETQIMALENAASSKEVLHAIKTGNTSLATTVKEGDIDKVADIMDEVNESINLVNEFGEALAQPVGPQIDDDELEAELGELESELVEEEVKKEPALPELPGVPRRRLAEPEREQAESPEEKERREMAELDALMS